jgi:O-antigen ligase
LTVNKQIKYPKHIQKWLNAYVFFLAWPFLIVFNSITFYIFVGLVFQHLKFYGSVFNVKLKYSVVFTFFLIIALFSLLVAPEITRTRGFINDMQLFVQYIYWTSLTLFVLSNWRRFNFIELSKYLLIGIIALIISFYLLKFKLNIGPIYLDFNPSRNGFVFQMLAIVPLTFIYITKSFGRFKSVIWLVFLTGSVVLSNGRSGAIIILIQAALLFYGIWQHKLARFRIPILLLLPIILYYSTVWISVEENSKWLSEKVESINPRLANLIVGQDDGDLSQDKSWLVRKMMVLKALEINKIYPWLGVGIGNFTKYDAKLVSRRKAEFERLRGADAELLNTRSAHNSYIQILAEMGNIGLGILLVIIFVPLLYYFYSFIRIKPLTFYYPFIALLGIAIHFYAISSITGAVTWFTIGMAWAGIRINSST